MKGNHGNFFKAVKAQFKAEFHCHTVESGHGRTERRTVELWQTLESLTDANQWAGLTSIIRVTSYRHLHKGQFLMIQKPQVRYYISSWNETVEQFARRIRDYWHVENKVHYVRDVTQGEDASRIRVQPLPNLFALARNLALNLYRDQGFDNMAQAQRLASFGLEQLKVLFRMK
nr:MULTISPECIES: ISAs1 family transposase [unclassified Microcoleus]